VLLGDLYRIPQQRRHIFQADSIRKQIDGKGIAKLVRVELHSRKLRKPCERSLPVVHAALDLAVARPEKIFSGKKRARPVQFFHHKIRQRDVDGDFRFRGIEEELVALELILAQKRHVPDPQPRVPQHQDECLYPYSISLSIYTLCRIQVARPEDLLEVFVRDGKGGPVMRDRGLDPFRRVRVHPLAVYAEPEERPEPFELLPGRDRGKLPPLTILTDLIDRERCDQSPLERFCELVRKQLVLSKRSARKVSRFAIPHECRARMGDAALLRALRMRGLPVPH
jgi:hypothetical protein